MKVFLQASWKAHELTLQGMAIPHCFDKLGYTVHASSLQELHPWVQRQNNFSEKPLTSSESTFNGRQTDMPTRFHDGDVVVNKPTHHWNLTTWKLTQTVHQVPFSVWFVTSVDLSSNEIFIDGSCNPCEISRQELIKEVSEIPVTKTTVYQSPAKTTVKDQIPKSRKTQIPIPKSRKTQIPNWSKVDHSGWCIWKKIICFLFLPTGTLAGGVK